MCQAWKAWNTPTISAISHLFTNEIRESWGNKRPRPHIAMLLLAPYEVLCILITSELLLYRLRRERTQLLQHQNMSYTHLAYRNKMPLSLTAYY